MPQQLTENEDKEIQAHNLAIVYAQQNVYGGNLFDSLQIAAYGSSTLQLGDIARGLAVPGAITGQSWFPPRRPPPQLTTDVFGGLPPEHAVMNLNPEELDPTDRTFYKTTRNTNDQANKVVAQNHARYNQSYYSEGHIFRIWQQGNSYIHKKTMLLIVNFNSQSTCLPVRWFGDDPDTTEEGDFKDRHMQLVKHTGPSSSPSPHLQARLDPNVELNHGLWVNLQEPYLIRYDVQIERCGTLTEPSLKALQRKYIDLLRERMRLYDE